MIWTRLKIALVMSLVIVSNCNVTYISFHVCFAVGDLPISVARWRVVSMSNANNRYAYTVVLDKLCVMKSYRHRSYGSILFCKVLDEIAKSMCTSMATTLPNHNPITNSLQLSIITGILVPNIPNTLNFHWLINKLCGIGFEIVSTRMLEEWGANTAANAFVYPGNISVYISKENFDKMK